MANTDKDCNKTIQKLYNSKKAQEIGYFNNKSEAFDTNVKENTIASIIKENSNYDKNNTIAILAGLYKISNLNPEYGSE